LLAWSRANAAAFNGNRLFQPFEQMVVRFLRAELSGANPGIEASTRSASHCGNHDPKIA
jgi:hypothetical protein